MIATIRLHSQQLTDPVFDNPKELVAYMGAMQAQEYTMAKWAIGIRLKDGRLSAVDEALWKGEIIRTHVMRPTWHFVAAEDIRWMLKLSAKHILSANDSYAKGRDLDISTEIYNKANDLLVKTLEGNRHQTKQELTDAFSQAGFETDNHQINRFLLRAEVEGLICNGIDQGNKATYALLDERVPTVQDISKEEALCRLARSYFRSHSPATLADFVWWSGLSITEARQAIGSIGQELIADRFEDQKMYVHIDCKESKPEDVFHLLPSFDEYLISYKVRTDVLKAEYHSKAFNRWGIFYPVILHNGHIVGNWNKAVKKKELVIETDYFEKGVKVKKGLLQAAEYKYKNYVK